MQLKATLFRTASTPSTVATAVKRIAAGAVLAVISACATENTKPDLPPPPSATISQEMLGIELVRIEDKAPMLVSEPPVTITALPHNGAVESRHEYYTEGEDWWPADKSADALYVRRVGEENPNSFDDHREALVRFSEIVATLTSAYLVSGDSEYAETIKAHMNAWFVNPKTRMNPRLENANAVPGRRAGSSLGVMDANHLTEVVRSAKLLSAYGLFSEEEETAIRAWFADYLDWLYTHPFADRERSHPSRRAIYWAMQAAAVADFLNDQIVLDDIRDEFKHRFIGKLMAQDGSFPSATGSPNAYGYSVSLLDALAMVAQIASTPEDNLWHYRSADGRSMKEAVQQLVPDIEDKRSWQATPDSIHWDHWPVRQASLVLAALAYKDINYLSVWQSLEADPEDQAILRHFPVRHPLLWLPNNMPKAAELREPQDDKPKVTDTIALK